MGLPLSIQISKMKLFTTFATAAALIAFSISTIADENHEIIEKVMKEGLKGDDSPMAKLLEGKLDEKETKSLFELVETMKGTKAPLGDQAKYEEKVTELIAALEAVARGKKDNAAIERLDKAQSCKACHTDHKPKKEKK